MHMLFWILLLAPCTGTGSGGGAATTAGVGPWPFSTAGPRRCCRWHMHVELSYGGHKFLLGRWRMLAVEREKLLHYILHFLLVHL